MNLLEVEEHSHQMEKNLQIVVKIPLALVVLVIVEGKKQMKQILDLHEVEMVAAPGVVHVWGGLELLKETVMLEIADKVPQQVEQMLRVEVVLIDRQNELVV